MKYSNLRHTIVRLRRNAKLFMPALAFALALGTTVVVPPPADPKTTEIAPPGRIPLVNWNS